MNTVMFSGGQLLFHRKFNPETVMKDLHKATTFMGVPTFYTRLMPHMSGVVVCHMRHQAGVESWNTHEGGGVWQIAHDGFSIEFAVEQQLSAAEQNRVHSDKEAVGVIDRKRVQQHIIRREFPDLDQGQRIGG